MSNILYNLDAMQIQEYQQNRYPCFFLDEVTEVLPGKYAKGYKNFTFNEWFFPAHFVDEPSVPGFIQVETMAQLFLMTFLTIDEYKGEKTGFIKADNIVFKKKIVPGNKLEMTATLKSFRHGIATGHIDSYVKGEYACGADYTIAIPSIVNRLKPKQN
jgi:3-hydroxyacyl-[acyl-carrier-protein] dehydratase